MSQLLTLSALFSDTAVLQCLKPLSIWGTAQPGSQVEISLGDIQTDCHADTEGRWRVEIPPQPAGGPFKLSARSEGETITSSDIWLGEVWVASGQSNMEWQVDSLEAKRSAPNPNVRMFVTPKRWSPEPKEDIQGEWQTSASETLANFSAVAYHFAVHLAKETGHKVGVIVSAWGGTDLICWLPQSYAEARPEYEPFAYKGDPIQEGEIGAFVKVEDEGIDPRTSEWTQPGYDDSAWDEKTVPGYWQDQGWVMNGAVWYRTTVELPADWVGLDLELLFGPADDLDHTWVNGELVGHTGADTPNYYSVRREYPIPARLVTGRTLTIAIRVFDEGGNGGIVGRVPTVFPVGKPELAIEADGRLRAKIEREFPMSPLQRMGVPPYGLYNGMIHAARGFAASGFLWYQGENDAWRAYLYPLFLRDLVTAWRDVWKDDSLAFGVVQLPEYMQQHDQPVESDWAELREAQRVVSESVPGVGMVVTLGLGDADDIHPTNKQPVGQRLADWALTQVYGKPRPYSGPMAVSHECGDGIVRVKFRTHGDLATTDGGAPAGFQIAGVYQIWYTANAVVAGDTVVLSSEDTPEPVAVRYAWQANPHWNLTDGSGLPASPFRTDDWPLSTMPD